MIAYLNAPAEAGGLPDVNEQSFTGGTILMAAVCQIDSAARLAFVWELVSRGANLCSIIDHDSHRTVDASCRVVSWPSISL